MPAGARTRQIRHSLALTGSVGVLAAVVGGGAWFAAREVEAGLERRARAALADADIAAAVHFDGRDAVLTGTVASAQEARRASILVADLPGTLQVVSSLQVAGAPNGRAAPSAPSAAPSTTPSAPAATATGRTTTPATAETPAGPAVTVTPTPAATSRRTRSAPAPQRVAFETASVSPAADSANYLKAVAEYLRNSPGTHAEVDGHSDNIGARAVNEKLSRARADAVVARLVALGVDPAQLRAQGYADTRPVASNRTPEGRAANRRVEIVFEGVN